MGITDTKSISNHIDENFRSIRKYHDHFYGEITLVEHKLTKKKFALVQKVILTIDKSLNDYLQERKNYNPSLITLNEYYHCSIDYCSGLEKYFFLLEYSSHTLYQEMVRRQQINEKFTSQEIIDIFTQMVDIIGFFKDQKQYKNLISNHHILYFNTKELKTLESLMKVENDTFEFDFHLITIEDGVKQMYLSPQAYYLLCNRERFEAKNVSLTESSIVFMLGMSFLECALLADITEVYNPYKKSPSYEKLNIILQQVQSQYGEQITQIVSEMVEKNPAKRPSIEKIKQYISTNLMRRKITIPKTIRADKFEIKSFKKQTLFAHKIK